jgi:hypothetical protein
MRALATACQSLYTALGRRSDQAQTRSPDYLSFDWMETGDYEIAEVWVPN